MSGVFIALYHGRNTADEVLDDWGFNGPIIGPVNVSWTYGNVKLHPVDWSAMEFLPTSDDMVKFEGKYYGDFEIVYADDLKLRGPGRRVIDFATFERIAAEERRVEQAQRVRDQRTCTSCGEERDDVERRYSFGYYAGRLCVPCCEKFEYNCGLHQPQGDPTTLAEFEAGGWDALEGEA